MKTTSVRVKKSSGVKMWCNEVLRPVDTCYRDTSSIQATIMRNLDVGLHGYTIKEKVGLGSIMSCKFAVRVWRRSKME